MKVYHFILRLNPLWILNECFENSDILNNYIRNKSILSKVSIQYLRTEINQSFTKTYNLQIRNYKCSQVVKYGLKWSERISFLFVIKSIWKNEYMILKIIVADMVNYVFNASISKQCYFNAFQGGGIYFIQRHNNDINVAICSIENLS